ncbi:MAG: NAD-binding protein [Chloroflexi bacterium]|nr:NAD-binding protein [Chloroflexota bacterium]
MWIGQWIRNIFFTDTVRRFRLTLAMLVLLLLGGTLFYWYREGMTLADAVYMTVIGLTTVGFGEPQTLSMEGRMFTVVFITVGVFIVFYAIGGLLDSVFSDEMWQSRERKRIRKEVMEIKDHYIICGVGRMGQQVVQEMQRRQAPFLIVDSDEEEEGELLKQGIPHVIGDATMDETLEMAGVSRATGLVTALSTDAANIATVLTARGLNAQLYIVARAAVLETERKLMRAGANRVVSPYYVGGRSMARALLTPVVHDFVAHLSDGAETEIGQVKVGASSPLVGQSIGKCDLRRIAGVTILAVQRTDGELVVNPSVQYELSSGDTLVVLGPANSILQIESKEAV